MRLRKSGRRFGGGRVRIGTEGKEWGQGVLGGRGEEGREGFGEAGKNRGRSLEEIQMDR